MDIYWGSSLFFQLAKSHEVLERRWRLYWRFLWSGGVLRVLVRGVSGKIGRELAICCMQRSNMGLYRDLYWILMTAAKILISSFLWLINIDGMSQVRHDGTCPASFPSFFWTGDAEYFACGSPYSLEKSQHFRVIPLSGFQGLGFVHLQ